MATRSQTLALYRMMMRESSKFNDFNFRHYFHRRIRDGFKESKSLTGGPQIQEQLTIAQKNLDMIRRQVTLSQLFGVNQPLSIELNNLK